MATETYIPLATVTLATSATNVFLTNISQDYSDLVIVSNIIISNGQEVGIRFNGDSGDNYLMINMRGTGGSTTTSSIQDSGYVPIQKNVSGNAVVITEIMGYSKTDRLKAIVNRAGSNNFGVIASAHQWADTSAVTSIALQSINGGSIATGSTFKLFGIHGEVV